MALPLVNCSDCGHDVSQNAKSCPNCGAQRTTRKTALLAWIIGIGFCCLLLSLCKSEVEKLANTDLVANDRASKAFYAGRRFVEKTLKSPGSAKWPRRSDAECGSGLVDSNLFMAWGYVDSQNGFGALIRSKWEAEVKDIGNQWELVSLKLGDEWIKKAPVEFSPPEKKRDVTHEIPKTEEAPLVDAEKEAGVQKSKQMEANTFKLHMARALNGDDFSQYELGLLYLNGKGVQRDETKALEWLHKSAAQDYTPAKKQLEKMGK